MLWWLLTHQYMSVHEMSVKTMLPSADNQDTEHLKATRTTLIEKQKKNLPRLL